MAIRMRRGNEADFDPSKMLPGEWAVSTDTKYVRMCFSPGIVLRMATYEAFESDMAEIRNILSQCQNIQTAVELIQQNVTASELVIENYVKEAKQYRDEAEQFRNEAFSTTPEGYEDLVKNVSDNTVKIDTIIEKAELNIKNNAKGNNIHLTDSAESKIVALELYGKTEQNAYIGKNFLDCRRTTDYSGNGITVTFDTIKQSISASGTATANTQVSITNNYNEIKEKIANGGTFVMSLKNATYDIKQCNISISYSHVDGTIHYIIADGTSVVFEPGSVIQAIALYIKSGTTVNLTDVKIQLEENNEATEWEPYVGCKPSPSPSYPQEIKSVVLNTIKTHGKNSLDLEAVTKNSTFDASGLINTSSVSSITDFILVSGKKNVTISNARNDTYTRIACYYDVNKSFISSEEYSSKKHTFTVPSNAYYMRIAVGVNIENIQLEIGVEATEYQPYQSTEITLSEPIELNGFNGVYDVVESGKITKKIKKRRLLRSDGWGAHANGWIYTMSISDFKYGDILIGSTYSPEDAFCTHLVYENNPNKITQKLSQGITMWYDTSYSGYSVAVYLPDMTSDEWNTFIDENEVYLVYELATPTTEELKTDFTALKTFYPETNVSNDADCDMSITYTADAKNYIDNKIALLTTALYNNI